MLTVKKVISASLVIMFLVISVSVVFITEPSKASAAITTFIKRSGDILYEDLDGDGTKGANEPQFRFISFNASSLIANEVAGWRAPDPWEQEMLFKRISELGGQVVRTYVISVGNSVTSFNRCVTAPNTFDETCFRAIDKAIQLANQYGIRLIIPLVDRYQYWGGITEYAAFRNKGTEDFWTDTTIRNDFKNTINYILNRTNFYTGVQYKNDKAILAWETGNELTAATFSQLYPWTSDIASYIKSIDSNHLVVDGQYGINSSSLTDPNIDIVSNHYYPDRGTNFVARAAADRAASIGRKPFIVGEFGTLDLSGTSNTALYTNLINEVISNGTTGAMIWELMMHNVDGGVFHHRGTNSLSFDWPASSETTSYDEVGTVNMMRNKAYQIRGMSVPALTAPEEPTLLPITYVDQIAWRTSVRAEKYDLERATSADGPWTVIGDDISNHMTYNNKFYDKTATIGNTYYYRIKAINSAGPSSYSSTVGPVTAAWSAPKQIIDELLDYSKMYSHTANIWYDETSANLMNGDNRKIARSSSTFENVTYKLGEDIRYFMADTYFWPGESVVDFKFYISPDNSTYTEITPTITSPGGADWTRKKYEGFTLPSGIRYLKIEFRNTSANAWNPQLARVEINTKLVDHLDNFNKVYSNTSDLGFDTSQSQYFNGDTSRLYQFRAPTGYQNVVYKTETDMYGFVADAYFWPYEAIVHNKFYTSADGSNYTELTPIRENLGGNWTRIKYSSYSLPAGTRYLKVEFRNQSTNYWSPQIGNVEIKTKDKLLDDMNDFLKMAVGYPTGPNLSFDTSSTSFFNGDASRSYRLVQTQDEVFYRSDSDMNYFKVDSYFWPSEPIVDFKIYLSGGNGTWTEFSPTKTTLGGNWTHKTYEGTSLPAGTKLLKIKFMNKSANNWTPQIGSVEIRSD